MANEPAKNTAAAGAPAQTITDKQQAARNTGAIPPNPNTVQQTAADKQAAYEQFQREQRAMPSAFVGGPMAQRPGRPAPVRVSMTNASQARRIQQDANGAAITFEPSETKEILMWPSAVENFKRLSDPNRPPELRSAFRITDAEHDGLAQAQAFVKEEAEKERASRERVKPTEAPKKV